MPAKKKKRGRPRKKEVEEVEIVEEEFESALPSTMKKIMWTILWSGITVIVLLSLVGAAGSLGDMIDRFVSGVFGWAVWMAPVGIIFGIWLYWKQEEFAFQPVSWLGFGIFLEFFLVFLHTFIDSDALWQGVEDGRGGGLLGFLLASPLIGFAGFWASLVISLFILTLGLLLWWGPVWFAHHPHQDDEETDEEVEEESVSEDEEWDEDEEERGPSLLQATGAVLGEAKDRLSEAMEKRRESAEDEAAEEVEDDFVDDDTEADPDSDSDENGAESAEGEIQIDDADQNLPTLIKPSDTIPAGFPLKLLHATKEKPTSGDIEFNKQKIQDTLADFGIEVKMKEVEVGPTFTQFSFKPAPGTRLSKITALANDLALALAAHPLRIEAPIPGKSLVGIEIPNKSAAMVGIKDLLSGKDFKPIKGKMELGIALGKDVSGQQYYADITKMPHVLIGGATGSGKSVCINTILTSMLYQYSPAELRLIMVDPKRVELSMYNDIPHLMTPVITDAKKTVNALKWAVNEMDRRYQLLSSVGRKNIASFNASSPEKMPYVVVVIDELADLMMAAASEVEALIIRLAQMARAVGIHLVLATQRPSVNVITGLIKANVPARIAFAVTSVIDSRTIIDTAGADKLIGRGDMLFMDGKGGKPIRIQGAFISEEETRAVTDYLKSLGEADYDESVTERQSAAGVGGVDTGNAEVGGTDFSEEDNLYEEVKLEVVRAGKASTSYIQRRFRIGYSRAARLMDMLEEDGVVGEQDGSKARAVLLQLTDSGLVVPKDGVPQKDANDGSDALEAAVLEHAEELDDDNEESEDEDKNRDDEDEYIRGTE